MCNEIYLDGVQWGCHGPTDSLKDLRKELLGLGVEVGETTIPRASQGGADTKKTGICNEDDGGRIGGEVRVLSMRRELAILEGEDKQAKQQAWKEKRLKVAVALLEAERDGKEKVLVMEESDTRRALMREAATSTMLQEHRVKVREYAEALQERAIDHQIDEVQWIVNEGHREMLDNARYKVAREFEALENCHYERAARDQMRREAINRIFKADSALFKVEASTLRDVETPLHTT